MRSLIDWLADQAITVLGVIAHRHREATRTKWEQQAYRTTLREATDAHLDRIHCRRGDCPRRCAGPVDPAPAG